MAGHAPWLQVPECAVRNKRQPPNVQTGRSTRAGSQCQRAAFDMGNARHRKMLHRRWQRPRKRSRPLGPYTNDVHQSVPKQNSWLVLSLAPKFKLLPGKGS